MAEQLLAIDCGTQSVRALLFNSQGELIAKERIPIEPYYSTHPVWPSRTRRYFGMRCVQPASKLLASRKMSMQRNCGCFPHHPARHRCQPG